MAFTNIWDDTFPPDTQLANLLGEDLRNFRVDVQQRMAAISGLDASKPDFGSDAQPDDWDGILFFAIDTGKVYQFNNPSWTDVTPSVGRGGTKYTTAGTATTGNGQTLFSIAIPAGILNVGNVIDIEYGFSLSGGASALIVVGGGLTFLLNGTQFAAKIRGYFSTTTALKCLINEYATASISNNVVTGGVSDVTAGLNIVVTQSGAGSISPTGMWVTVA